MPFSCGLGWVWAVRMRPLSYAGGKNACAFQLPLSSFLHLSTAALLFHYAYALPATALYRACRGAWHWQWPPAGKGATKAESMPEVVTPQ